MRGGGQNGPTVFLGWQKSPVQMGLRKYNFSPLKFGFLTASRHEIDGCFVAENEALLLGTSDLMLNTYILYVINDITSKFRCSILIKI